MSISKISPFQTIYVVKHLDLVCISKNNNDDDDDVDYADEGGDGDDGESKVSEKNLRY